MAMDYDGGMLPIVCIVRAKAPHCLYTLYICIVTFSQGMNFKCDCVCDCVCVVVTYHPANRTH